MELVCLLPANHPNDEQFQWSRITIPVEAKTDNACVTVHETDPESVVVICQELIVVVAAQVSTTRYLMYT